MNRDFLIVVVCFAGLGLGAAVSCAPDKRRGDQTIGSGGSAAGGASEVGSRTGGNGGSRSGGSGGITSSLSV